MTRTLKSIFADMERRRLASERVDAVRRRLTQCHCGAISTNPGPHHVVNCQYYQPIGMIRFGAIAATTAGGWRIGISVGV